MDDVSLRRELEKLLTEIDQVFDQLQKEKSQQSWFDFQFEIFETQLYDYFRTSYENSGTSFTEKLLQRDVKLHNDWQELKKEVIRQNDVVEGLELRREKLRLRKDVLLALARMFANN